MLQVSEDGPRRRSCCADVPYTNSAVPPTADNLPRHRSHTSSHCAIFTAHVLRMHFAPAAIKHGIISRKNSLVRILNQRLREACACATTDNIVAREACQTQPSNMITCLLGHSLLLEFCSKHDPRFFSKTETEFELAFLF